MSNIVQVTTAPLNTLIRPGTGSLDLEGIAPEISAPAPSSTLYLAVAWRAAMYNLFGADLTLGPFVSNEIPTSLGFVTDLIADPIDIEPVDDVDPLIGASVSINEAVAAGAARTFDMGVSWEQVGGPLFLNAPQRDHRVAAGNLGGSPFYVYAGTRNTGQTSSASSSDFPVTGTSWTPSTTDMTAAIGALGIAGVDFHDGFFYAYSNDGKIARSNNGINWSLVASGGPSNAFVSASSLPLAKFDGIGNTIVGMFCTRLVVSTNGGATWDMSSFINAVNNANIVGGQGFSNPYGFGIAGGAVAAGDRFVAVYTESPTSSPIPHIKWSSLTAGSPSTSWTTASVPAGPTYILDVVYDSFGAGRFIALGYKFDSVNGSIYYLLESADGATWTISYQASISDDGVRNVGYLAIANAPSFVRPDVAPNHINITAHTVTAKDAANGGAYVIFGAGDNVPLGELYIGGDGTVATVVDGSPIAADPLSLHTYGKIVTSQWWNDASTPDAAAYEIRMTILSGDDPDDTNFGGWVGMDNECFAGYAAFLGTARTGQWHFEIREKNTQTIYATATITVTVSN